MKLFDRGYWVSKLFVYQSVLYYFLYSIRFRSLLWFSACNPAIPLGGMLDDKKSEIYNSLPPQFLPKTLLVSIEDDLENLLLENGFNFPFIIKPDIGFKGLNVNKVNNFRELKTASNVFGKDSFLIQEFVDFKKEFSLMFYKDENFFGISSLVEKSYPYVVGNGVDNIKDLISSHNNPFLKKSNLIQLLDEPFLMSIPKINQKVIVEQIGNYSRGSKFHSRMDIITKELCESTKDHFSSILGLNFFRVDFKSDSLTDYREGRFKILEINGAKSEPLHIYDPEHNLFAVIKDIHQHWMRLVSLVKKQKQVSYDFPSTSLGWKSFVATRKIGK